MNRYMLHEPRPTFEYTLGVGSRVKYKQEEVTQQVLKDLRGTIVNIQNDRAVDVKWDTYTHPLGIWLGDLTFE